MAIKTTVYILPSLDAEGHINHHGKKQKRSKK
jgi:hypothetical protein